MAITTAISDLVDFIYQAIASVFNGIYGIIHAILSTITGLFSGILHVVGNTISSLGSVVSSITGFIAGTLNDALQKKASKSCSNTNTDIKETLSFLESAQCWHSSSFGLLRQANGRSSKPRPNSDLTVFIARTAL